MITVFSSFVLQPAEVQFIDPVITYLLSTEADFICILPPQFSTLTGTPARRNASCFVYSLLALVASLITRILTPLKCAAIKASANSLEVRSPFVDNRLIEYVLSRETKYIEINNKKNILKKYLSTDFDSSFLNRRKQGFVFDLENWVYSNKSEIAETFKLGEVVVNTNKDILKLLSIKKSRINANRLWKLFVLEKYLQNLP